MNRPLIGFQERFNKLLKDKSLDCMAVAKACDVDRKTVYHWKWGSTTPDMVSIARMSYLFQVTTDFLILGK